MQWYKCNNYAHSPQISMDKVHESPTWRPQTNRNTCHAITGQTKSIYDTFVSFHCMNFFFQVRARYYCCVICDVRKARFKRRATAVPNSIDRIKFDFSTAVTRRLKPSRATAVQHGKPCCAIRQQLDLVINVALLPCRTQFINYKYIRIHLKVCQTVSLFLCFVFGNSRSIRLNLIRRLKPSRAKCHAAVELQFCQLSTAVARRLKQA